MLKASILKAQKLVFAARVSLPPMDKNVSAAPFAHKVSKQKILKLFQIGSPAT